MCTLVIKIVIGLVFIVALSRAERKITKRADDPWFLEKSAWPSMPYDFGYEIRDLEGNEQYRNEHHNGHQVTGSYGYFGPDGIYRHVDYVADERGFRAQIRTSEPGVAAQNPANVKMIVEPLLPQRVPPPGGRIHRPLGGSGGFDSGVLGDPVLERGLSGPSSRGSVSSGPTRATTSGSSIGSDGNGGNVGERGIAPGVIGNARIPTDGIPSRPIGSHRLRPRPLEPIANRDLLLGSRQPPSTNGGRPLGNNENGDRVSLGGPLDDLFAGRDPRSRGRPLSGGRGEGSAYPASRDPSLMGMGDVRSSPPDYIDSRGDDRINDRDPALERNHPRHSSGTKGSSNSLPEITQQQFSKRIDSTKGGMQGADSASTSMANSENGSNTSSEKETESEITNLNREGLKGGSQNSSPKDEISPSSVKGGGRANNEKTNKGPIRPTMKVFFTEGPTTPSAGPSTSSTPVTTERETDITTSVKGMQSTGRGESEGQAANNEQQTNKAEKRGFESTDQQVRGLRFDEATDRLSRLRARSYAVRRNRAYVAPVRTPTYAFANAEAGNRRRAYGLTYQQYSALRNRIPRDRPDSVSGSQAISSRLIKKNVPLTETTSSLTDSLLARSAGISPNPPSKAELALQNRLLTSKLVKLDERRLVSLPLPRPQSSDSQFLKRSGLLIPVTTLTPNELNSNSSIVPKNNTENIKPQSLEETLKPSNLSNSELSSILKPGFFKVQTFHGKKPDLYVQTAKIEKKEDNERLLDKKEEDDDEKLNVKEESTKKEKSNSASEMSLTLLPFLNQLNTFTST